MALDGKIRSYNVSMTKKEALRLLKRIQNDPSLADQFTEDEIEEMESIVNQK